MSSFMTGERFSVKRDAASPWCGQKAHLRRATPVTRPDAWIYDAFSRKDSGRFFPWRDKVPESTGETFRAR